MESDIPTESLSDFVVVLVTVPSETVTWSVKNILPEGFTSTATSSQRSPLLAVQLQVTEPADA